MYLGEILGLAFLGEIALGKIFEMRKFWGNELGEMRPKYSTKITGPTNIFVKPNVIL